MTPSCSTCVYLNKDTSECMKNPPEVLVVNAELVTVRPKIANIELEFCSYGMRRNVGIATASSGGGRQDLRNIDKVTKNAKPV